MIMSAPQMDPLSAATWLMVPRLVRPHVALTGLAQKIAHAPRRQTVAYALPIAPVVVTARIAPPAIAQEIPLNALTARACNASRILTAHRAQGHVT